MLVAAGAGWTVFSDAGLVDFSQRTLERGPQCLELRLPFLSCVQRAIHEMCTSLYVCITLYIYNQDEKKHLPTKLPPPSLNPSLRLEFLNSSTKL